ncbi:xanthine dehydrogenase [Aphanothece hegewaldii CCALA 016]|uniref:Xanthine dehydrogenase n=1 Tax=Aphanothece hegewaldii CCALA 016 TaxID=2107694 RepID=A0A2T1M3T5_9CHRO|nr:XdhC/CoxI family protein [Aphanothece hegewaldii]PSF39499.1 xanthine dehydrogenase [Aphanothece hegewaldii CCALA 016]
MINYFYQQLRQAIQSGMVVLATVVNSRGSVPREIGAKMIIFPDGTFFNTIGGGAGEAKVIRQGMRVLETGEKQFVEIDLTGSPQRETQGVCGGIMQVWLERWRGENAINLVDEILSKLNSGQSVTVVTPFLSEQSPYIYINNVDPVLTPQPNNAFIETLQPSPTLLIVGAGHIGEQLAIIAHLIGFQIMIQDDRTFWANSQRYPQASHIFNQPISTTLEQLAQYEQMYVALVTRGYKYDLEALEALLARSLPCQYIGMIGSQKRVIQVYQSLTHHSDRLSSIYAPIGLDIGALTPEEIAVSISAELILVRRGGTGKPLSKLIKG